MNKQVRYSKPPIVEAIIDIQVDIPSTFDVEKLGKLQKKQVVKKRYTTKRSLQHIGGQIRFEGNDTGHTSTTSSTSAEKIGFMFATEDGKQLFQATKKGFSFNKLSPYSCWEEIVAEAKILWEEYRQLTHPRGLKRIAVRYINRFEFPVSPIKLETYFRTYPEVSRDLPQVMAGFFFRFNLPLQEDDLIATITQTDGEPNDAGLPSTILDIDLFKTANLPSSNDIWDFYEKKIRHWKNAVFESCITDETRKLIL